MDVGMIQTSLLKWYDSGRRDLPWRKDTDPYRVWVSEIMLQQTRVETVIPYYLRFVEAVPSVECLAQISDEALLKLWEGLGYYRRAANLKKAAVQVIQQYAGRLPGDVSELRRLPGIGLYTAGAIASIAFGRPVPAADGNVFRIMARLKGLEESIDDSILRKKLTSELSSWIPSNRPGDFNQALMDLGATICLPNGMPLCQKCPLCGQCRAYEQGKTSEIPRRTERKARKVQRKTFFLIFLDEKLALQRRVEGSLLENLWEPPGIEGWPDEADCLHMLRKWGITAANIEPLPSAKHVFTHLEWHMHAFRIAPVQNKEPERWVWVSAEDLAARYPVPAAFRYYLDLPGLWR